MRSIPARSLQQQKKYPEDTTYGARPRAVTYTEAMTALHDAYHTVRDLLQTPLSAEILERLVLLRDRLELLLHRDNGRRR